MAFSLINKYIDKCNQKNNCKKKTREHGLHGLVDFKDFGRLLIAGLHDKFPLKVSIFLLFLPPFHID